MCTAHFKHIDYVSHRQLIHFSMIRETASASNFRAAILAPVWHTAEARRWPVYNFFEQHLHSTDYPFPYVFFICHDCRFHTFGIAGFSFSSSKTSVLRYEQTTPLLVTHPLFRSLSAPFLPVLWSSSPDQGNLFWSSPSAFARLACNVSTWQKKFLGFKLVSSLLPKWHVCEFFHDAVN